MILFDNGKLVVFSSSKFHHGQSAYKGYALGYTKETNGKIVKLKENITGHFEHEAEMISESNFYDISITKNVCALLIAVILICVVFFSVAKSYKRRPNMAPKGLQSLMEVVIVFIRDEVVIPSIGTAKYKKYLPYILTLFFFILVNNLIGLIPIFPGGFNLS